MGKVLSILKIRRFADADSPSKQPKKNTNIFSEIPTIEGNNLDEFTEDKNNPSTSHHNVEGGCTCICLTKENLCITGCRIDNSIIVQSYENLQKIRHRWVGHTRDVIKVSSKNNQVVSASRDATIALWQIDQDSCVGKLCDHELAVTAVDFDRRHDNGGTSDLLVSGSRDNTVKFWDLETLECVSSVTESRNLVTDIRWNCGSDVIAQTSEDKTLKLWDARTQEIAHTLPVQHHIASCCDIYGDYCVTGYKGFVGEGCQLFLWDLRAMDVVSQYIGHKESVTSCRFLPGTNQQFVSTSNDGFVRVWDRDRTSSVFQQNLQCGPLTGVGTYDCNNLVVTSLSEGVKKIRFALPND